MKTEQDKTLEALKMAVQMEIDGKTYYLRASQTSSNQLGRELFNSLAAEEDIHRQKFEEIYDAIRRKKDWPKPSFPPNMGKGLKTVFAKAMAEIGSNVKAQTTELEAVRTAMEMENRTYDYYRGQGNKASYDPEIEYYEALAGQERTHYLVLLDYYEYLSDPPGWFIKKEHHSLDGG